MDAIVTTLQAALAAGSLLALYRLIVGPTIHDRATALDVLLLLIASGVAAEAARSGEEAFTPLLIVVSLVAFLATATIARFSDWRKEDQ